MLPNKKIEVEGLCKYCGKKFTVNEMIEHLSECKIRDKKVYDVKKEEGFFDILITSSDDRNYWMIIEVSERSMLKEIDTFLREIWLGNEECLSYFEIKNKKYKYIPGNNVFYKEPANSMYHSIKNITDVGKTFKYVYNHNKSTEIELNVFKHRIGIKRDEDNIVLLSRNITSKKICDICRKNIADWVEPNMYSLGKNAFWCNECREKILNDEEIEQLEYTESFLPFCNSPRMGIDNYKGSDFYPEEFKPDSDMKLSKENEYQRVSKEVLEKFKRKRNDIYHIIRGWENNYTDNEELNKKRDMATLEQWRELYDVAEKIKQFKVWKCICEFEIIAIKKKGEEPIFYSVLGESGNEYGIDIYEGYDNLKGFIIDNYRDVLNISKSYTKTFRKKLSCRWGNIEDFSKEQLGIIKELGLKYRGRGNWLSFRSFDKGYSPCNLGKDEVVRMISYLKDFNTILEKFIGKLRLGVDLDFNEILCIEYIEDENEWKLYTEEIPLEEYFRLSEYNLEDKSKLNRLKATPKVESVLEVDIIPLWRIVNDEKYKKPITPSIYGILDVRSGNVISNKISKPDDDAESLLIEEVERFIAEVGRPREIRTTNSIISSRLDSICEELDINLNVKKKSSLCKKFGEYIMYEKKISKELLN